MAYTAIHKHARISARKVRPLADLIRGKAVDDALAILRYQPQRGARMLEKLIKSAVAIATDLSKGQVDVDNLVVKHLSVDQGPTARRFMPRAMGRATPIRKKTSHVHVVLAETRRK